MHGACTGNDEVPPLATGSPTAATAAAPTSTELPSEPSPSGTPEPVPTIELREGFPVDAAGPLLVYRKDAIEGQGGPVYRIAVYDLGSERELGAFEIGSNSARTQDFVLAGRRIIVNLGHTLVSLSLAGDDERVLRTVPDADTFMPGYHRPLLSPDGTTLAVTEISGDEDHHVLHVLFLDAATGQELAAVEQSDDTFPAFVGDAVPITWRDDGTGIVVRGYTYSERPGGLATVLLDGSVRVYEGGRHDLVAPTGRIVARWIPVGTSVDCVFGERLAAVDLDSGAEVAAVVQAGTHFVPFQWSRNGRSLLYWTQPVDLQGRDCWDVERQWHLVHIDGRDGELVPDPERLVAAWRAERFSGFDIDVTCPDRTLRVTCSGNTAHSLTVDGMVIDRGTDMAPIALVPVP